MSGSGRWVILAATLMHSLLLGGTVFGWPSLVVLLERENQYAELCDPEADPGSAVGGGTHT